MTALCLHHCEEIDGRTECRHGQISLQRCSKEDCDWEKKMFLGDEMMKNKIK